mgnify:CR=1 FL=1
MFLKLAQADLVRRTVGATPLLLVDEMFAILDRPAAEEFLRRVEGEGPDLPRHRPGKLAGRAARAAFPRAPRGAGVRSVAKQGLSAEPPPSLSGRCSRPRRPGQRRARAAFPPAGAANTLRVSSVSRAGEPTRHSRRDGMPKRVVILGAAGRDFHNFNVVFRDDRGLRGRGVHGDADPQHRRAALSA